MNLNSPLNLKVFLGFLNNEFVVRVYYVDNTLKSIILMYKIQ